jgi:hypothetical protein
MREAVQTTTILQTFAGLYWLIQTITGKSGLEINGRL